MSAKRYQLVAECFDHKGKRISLGMNSYSKTHPLQASHAKRLGLDHKIYLHAEVQAILRAKDKVIHSVHVSRFDANSNPVSARPCGICISVMKDFGVKKVSYTTSDGVVEQSFDDFE